MEKREYDIKLAKKSNVGIGQELFPKIFNHISIPTAEFLIKFTNITPNQITLLSFFVMVATGVFFGVSGFTIYPHQFRVIGALLAFLFFFLDTLDGKIARATNQKSVYGKWLDSILGMIFPLLFFFTLGFGLRTNSSILIGSLAALCFPMQYLIIYFFKLDIDPLISKKGIELVRKDNPLRYIYGSQLIYPLLLIGCFINRPLWVLIFFATFGNFFWLVVALMQLRAVLNYEKK